MIRRLIFSAAGIVFLAATWSSLRGAELDIQIVDEEESPLPARVLVRPHGGECVLPEDAVELRVGPDRWFMSPGESRVEVPSGSAQVRVERGLEYVRYNEDIDISRPQGTARIALRRWVDMQGRGYLCGENHIHVDASMLGPMLAAVRASIAEGFQMLDRFEASAREAGDPRYLPATLDAVEQARQRLRSCLEENP